jgi:hypothetical protein
MKVRILAVIVTVGLMLGLIVTVAGSLAVAVSEDPSNNLTKEQFGVPVYSASDSGSGSSDNKVYSAFKKVCPFH